MLELGVFLQDSKMLVVQILLSKYMFKVIVYETKHRKGQEAYQETTTFT